MKFEIHFFDNHKPIIIDALNIESAMVNPPEGAKMVQPVGYNPTPRYVDIIKAEIYFQAMPQMLAAYAGKYILCDKAGDMLTVATTKKDAIQKRSLMQQ